MTYLFRRASVSLLSLSLLTAIGCAGSPLGDTVQRSLEADPTLADNDPFGTQPASEDAEAAARERSESSADPADAETAAEASGDGDAADRVPEPGDPDFIGPVYARTVAEAPDAGEPETAAGASEGDQIPDELRTYWQDMVALDLLKATRQGEDETPPELQPAATIQRGQYAEWLLAANNRFYQDQPSKRIRAGASNAQPAFQDVPPSSPYFEAVQGLAEAGLIPSALTGNSTAITFRPNDPLTREDLILWKVPLDLRGSLPTATVEAVQQAWGFQDAAAIDPFALRAILGDYQNGDLSNIRRAFGYTTLFQPDKAVSQAEAAAVLWRFGTQTEGISAAQVLQRTEDQPSEAEAAPNRQPNATPRSTPAPKQ